MEAAGRAVAQVIVREFGDVITRGVLVAAGAGTMAATAGSWRGPSMPRASPSGSLASIPRPTTRSTAARWGGWTRARDRPRRAVAGRRRGRGRLTRDRRGGPAAATCSPWRSGSLRTGRPWSPWTDRPARSVERRSARPGARRPVGDVRRTAPRPPAGARLVRQDRGRGHRAPARRPIVAAARHRRLGGWRLPKLTPTMHKGDRGRVTVVGGSNGMTGAALHAARAALAAGRGWSSWSPDRRRSWPRAPASPMC